MTNQDHETSGQEAPQNVAGLMSLEDAARNLGEGNRMLLCMAVIAEAVGCAAERREAPDDPRKWRNIVEQGSGIIAAILEEAGILPGEESCVTSTGMAMPNLASIGVRMCTVCGCTDDHACEEGCWWTGDALCSSCGPGQEADQGKSQAELPPPGAAACNQA